jgi:hypothetical protein
MHGPCRSLRTVWGWVVGPPILITLLVFVQGAVCGAAAMNFGQGSPEEYGWRGGMHNVSSVGLLLFLFGIVYWYYVVAVGAALAIAVWYVRRVRRRVASETLPPRDLVCPEVQEPGRPDSA